MRLLTYLFISILFVISISAANESLPSFDSGKRIVFNAEDNETVAYENNPAKVTYFEKTTLLTDFGGDLSFAAFKFSSNGTDTDPGSDPSPDGEAVSVSYTFGTTIEGLVISRIGEKLVLGGGGGYDINAIKIGYNGTGLAMAPYYLGAPGLTNLEIRTPGYFGKLVFGFEFGKSSLGASFDYYDAKDDFTVNYEYYGDEVSNGTRGLKDMTARFGYQYRTEGFNIGAGLGYAILDEIVDWSYKRDVGYYDVYENIGEGSIKGNGYIVDIDSKFKVAGNVALGGGFGTRIIPKITANYKSTDVNNGIPYYGSEADLGEGKESIYKIRSGVAFYPDAKTTLAFDYNFDIYKASFDSWNQFGYTVDTYDLSSHVSYTQLGAERWINDDLEARLGWRQNIFSLPRNVVFAGVQYNITPDLSISYDYLGEHVGIDNISVFTVLKDIIHPGSHKFTLSYIF